MEYRYALEHGKPVIGFLHEDPLKLPAKFVEQTASAQRKLHLIRDLVGSKLCKFYSSPADLGSKVSRSITQLRKQVPATGWIRADILDKFASSDEMLKLVRENDELKERLYQLGLEKPAAADLLASGKEEFEVDFFFDRFARNSETNSFRKVDEAQDSMRISWDDLFAILAPELLERPGYWRPARILAEFIENSFSDELQKKYPDERFRNFVMSSRSCDTILLQFRALRLFTLNGEKWALTPYGDNYLTGLLGVPKGQTKNN